MLTSLSAFTVPPCPSTFHPLRLQHSHPTRITPPPPPSELLTSPLHRPVAAGSGRSTGLRTPARLPGDTPLLFPSPASRHTPRHRLCRRTDPRELHRARLDRRGRRSRRDPAEARRSGSVAQSPQNARRDRSRHAAASVVVLKKRGGEVRVMEARAKHAVEDGVRNNEDNVPD